VSATGPAAVVGRVADALNFAGKPVNGSRLFVLGVGDPASGPGLAVLELLIQKGARVEYHDPAVPTLPAFRNYPRLRLVSRAVTAEAVAACDAVVVLAGPAADAGALAYKFAPLVIDARVAIASAA
jgi:UDP-N-acetyl-D-glucosamine dehydrogenase